MEDNSNQTINEFREKKLVGDNDICVLSKERLSPFASMFSGIGAAFAENQAYKLLMENYKKKKQLKSY